jgi:hypothetical protein
VIKVTIREYDPETGSVISNIDSIDFGGLTPNGDKKIKIIDVSVSGASVSSIKMRLKNSGGIIVAPGATSVTNGFADAGNFGIETASSFSAKTDLSTFFSDAETFIDVPLRSNNVSNYIYLSINPKTYMGKVGEITYGFQYVVDASSKLSSSFSSSSSSSSLSSSSSSSSDSLSDSLSSSSTSESFSSISSSSLSNNSSSSLSS